MSTPAGFAPTGPKVPDTAKWERKIETVVTLEEWKESPLARKLATLPRYVITDKVHYNKSFRQDTYKMRMPRLYLVSGCSLSVQAGEHMYCEPRNNDGPYTHVEVGFIEGSPLPESWKPYAEDLTAVGPLKAETVFPYVPLEMVMFFIGAHGGIDNKKSFGLIKSWDMMIE